MHPLKPIYPSDMDIVEFTDIFLPNILSLYVDGEMPLHALVDIDTWKRVFPFGPSHPENEIQWYQVQISCNLLKDHTLLFTFTLPEPTSPNETKFAAFRLNPQDKDITHAVYYVLRKPQCVDDDWNIFYLPFPEGRNKRALKFCRKIDGTDSLRNFILTVQQIDFVDQRYSETWFNRILQLLGQAGSLQNETLNYNLSPSFTK